MDLKEAIERCRDMSAWMHRLDQPGFASDDEIAKDIVIEAAIFARSVEEIVIRWGTFSGEPFMERDASAMREIRAALRASSFSSESGK